MKENSSQEAAQVDLMGALASSVNIPVLANGDVYTRADMCAVMQAAPRGAAGVMLGRPLLLNPSLLRHLRPSPCPPPLVLCGDDVLATTTTTPVSGSEDDPADSLDLDAHCLPIRTVVQHFLQECIRFEPPFQIIKYTIQEMNSQRRHRHEKLVSDMSLFVPLL